MMPNSVTQKSVNCYSRPCSAVLLLPIAPKQNQQNTFKPTENRSCSGTPPEAVFVLIKRADIMKYSWANRAEGKHLMLPEGEQLWASYQQALDCFSARVSALTSPDLQPFELLGKVRQCREANFSCMKAHATWERHLKNHGCDPTTRENGAGKLGALVKPKNCGYAIRWTRPSSGFRGGKARVNGAE